MASVGGLKLLSQWIVGYMAVGPIAVAADLAWRFLPDTPRAPSFRLLPTIERLLITISAHG